MMSLCWALISANATTVRNCRNLIQEAFSPVFDLFLLIFFGQRPRLWTQAADALPESRPLYTEHWYCKISWLGEDGVCRCFCCSSDVIGVWFIRMCGWLVECQCGDWLSVVYSMSPVKPAGLAHSCVFGSPRMCLCDLVCAFPHLYVWRSI